MSEKSRRVIAKTAVYLKPEDPAEQGNPFIEALPEIWTRSQIIEGLTRYPNNLKRLQLARVEVRMVV